MPSLRPKPKQIAIAFDQFCNTLVGGWADETFSARCWRLHQYTPGWALARKMVDALFFFDKNHCQTSATSEEQDTQRPPEQRTPQQNPSEPP